MLYNNIIKGEFIDRPNRFIANVLIDGCRETVHVKNTGRCNINNSDDIGSSVNQLIIECAKSKACLEKLYLMFKDYVFAVAYSITQDYHLSEDCVAETFVRLTRIKHFSASKGDGKGFILTVARNVALEYRRRFKREVMNDIIQNYGCDDRIVEDSIYINQLLKVLNDKQRQTVILKCCADMTFKQISKVMKYMMV